MNFSRLSLASLAAVALHAASCMVPTSALAQSGSRLDPEPVAETQAYRDTTLELAIYEFEEGRAYGRKHAAKSGGARLIAKRSSKDQDASEQGAIRVGASVVLCVYASQQGTLTIWSRVGDKKPAVVYPNQYTPSLQGAGPIGADEEVCVGHTKEFRLRVRGEDGQIDTVYAHWAPSSEGQLAANDFPEIGRSKSVGRSESKYGAATVRYRISK